MVGVICWDKDRFGKDYLGEFDLALEEIFQTETAEQEPRWYPLKSKRPGKKTSIVSGEVQLQFTLLDTTNPSISNQQLFEKFYNLIGSVSVSSRNVTPTETPLLTPSAARSGTTSSADGLGDDDDDDDLTELEEDIGDETEDPSKPETAEKRRKRLRIKSLKKKRRQDPYAFTNGDSDVVGIIYLEVSRITDLPP